MNVWNNLSLQLKLQLTIVLFMVLTLIFGQLWIQNRFEHQAIQQVKSTIMDEADSIANALTTMMLTGVISERKIFLDQLTHRGHIKDIHIARNTKVVEQYGEGIDNESRMDALERKAVATKEVVFEEIAEDGQKFLRGVVPLIASENQMGKNCLDCHDVPSGYVNGTISIVISLKESEEFIKETEELLWIGQFGWQILLFIIIMFIMQLLLTKPIQRVRKTIETVSQDNDLTLKVNYPYNDELGEIADQMNHLIQVLQEDFEKISSGANQVSGYSTRIKESSSHINQRSEQQGNKLADVVASVEEISRTTQMVANNTAEVASLSENASQAAVQGGEIISQSIEGISHIRDTVISIANTIQSLQDRSQQIGEITIVIDDIAEQTNLLALNAAIEAARAGEQGRGFAVVADEVRKLAERTSKATQEITQRISAIQAETGKAADGMNKGREEVDNGVTLAEQAGNSLKSIVTLVEDVSSKLSNISISMDEQRSAVEEIASNVSEVANHASDNAKDIDEANKVAEELEEISNSLRSLINTFKF